MEIKYSLPIIDKKTKVKPLESLILEASSACNLKCKMCPQPTMKRKKENMSWQTFKKTIDNTWFGLNRVAFNNWGEPLLNPNIHRMVYYCKNLGVQDTIYTTNLKRLDIKTLGQVVNSGLDILEVSMDGVGKTYEFVRGTGYEGFVNRLDRLLSAKDTYRPDMKIGLVMTVFDETKDDINEFKSQWEGVVDYIKLQPRLTFSGEREQPCPELWGKDHGRLVVLSNGDITTCCADYEGKNVIGNVNNINVREAWGSLLMNYRRSSQLTGDFGGACKTCNEYESPVANKRFTKK